MPNTQTGTSSQRHTRNLTRKCKTESCARFVTKDGSLGLCGYCYRLAKRAGKKKPLTEAEQRCAVRDSDIILPVRQKFEWTGNLQESLARINVPEEG